MSVSPAWGLAEAHVGHGDPARVRIVFELDAGLSSVTPVRQETGAAQGLPSGAGLLCAERGRVASSVPTREPHTYKPEQQ